MYRAICRLVVLMAALSTSAWAADEACTPTRDGRLVCPAPESRCVTDRAGEVVCSTPRGGIEVDRYGVPVCGAGYCTKDLRGDVFCSNAPGGAASTDRYGAAACFGSCMPASAQACVKPRPAN
jgi:hypothetical protein